jgi:hypothetical protein
MSDVQYLLKMVQDVNSRLDKLAPTDNTEQVKTLISGAMLAFEAKADAKIAQMQRVLESLQTANTELARVASQPKQESTSMENVCTDIQAMAKTLNSLVTTMAKPVKKTATAELPSGTLKLVINETR